VSLEHRRSHNSTDIFVEITNNTLYESKLYSFLLCQKSLDIKIMFHEDITYRKYIRLSLLLRSELQSDTLWDAIMHEIEFMCVDVFAFVYMCVL